jgi:hypothetical protein
MIALRINLIEIIVHVSMFRIRCVNELVYIGGVSSCLFLWELNSVQRMQLLPQTLCRMVNVVYT